MPECRKVAMKYMKDLENDNVYIYFIYVMYVHSNPDVTLYALLLGTE